MNRKFFKSLRGLYEPMLVLVVIASAALLIGALYYALKAGSRGAVIVSRSQVLSTWYTHRAGRPWP